MKYIVYLNFWKFIFAGGNIWTENSILPISSVHHSVNTDHQCQRSSSFDLCLVRCKLSDTIFRNEIQNSINIFLQGQRRKLLQVNAAAMTL